MAQVFYINGKPVSIGIILDKRKKETKAVKIKINKKK